MEMGNDEGNNWRINLARKVTTCVSEALLLWLPFLFIIEMSVGRQTERKEEIKGEKERVKARDVE